MASKSTGQWIGTIAGAVIGFFVPGSYVALGAAIGGAIGGAIDPPKGPSITGPRLDDQSFTSSTYGATLARGYGTFPVAGNIVWLEGDKYREVTTTDEQGGKGGGGAEVTSYTYYATFAVSLLRVNDPAQTVSLRRLWIGTKLVFDASGASVDSTIAGAIEGVNFTFYDGRDDQTPNARWQADKGINAVSGYPGRCYIVIEDLDLTPYSNTLAMAQIKAELSITQPVVSDSDVGALQNTFDSTGPVASLKTSAITISESGAIDYGLSAILNYTNTGYGAVYRRLIVRESDKQTGSADHLIPAVSGVTCSNAICTHSTAVSSTAFIQVSHSLSSNTQFIRYVGPDYATSPMLTTSEYTYGTVPRIAADDLGYWVAGRSAATKIHRIDGEILSMSSTATVQAGAIAHSENYVFVIDHAASSASTCTVKRFMKGDLSLDATYVQTVPGNSGASNPGSLFIVSDSEFYVAADGICSRWVGGVAESLGSVFSTTGVNADEGMWFRVLTPAPFLALFVWGQGSPTIPGPVRIAHGVVDAATASLRNIVTDECALAGVGAADIDLSELTDSVVRGYRLSSIGSVRAALEPLQARFPFDVAQSGYKIRFVSRGSASVATIEESDLAASAPGDNDQILMPTTREMETQLARKVTVRYLDPAREYDIGEQYADRPSVSSINERSIELAIVLTSDEAAQAADILLSAEWIERTAFGPFVLPPNWISLEVADVVTVNHRGMAHELRLSRIEYMPDGRISCHGRMTAAHSYTSTATGEESSVPGASVVPLRGTSTAVLLDIPRLDALQDNPGITAVMYGFTDGWPGGVLIRSDDYGTTWQTAMAFETKASVFTVAEAGAVPTAYAIDSATVLTLTPEHDAATVYSITETQLYAAQNIAAWGVDGRWEIVAFKTAVDNSGTYTATDFLRGLYGTEWAASQHAAGDYLVLLSTTTARFIGLPTAAIGSERLWRSVTQGSTISSAPDMADTYDANNLLPLAPVDLNGSRSQTTDDWTIIWQRRTRWPVELLSGSDVPLGETSESYEIQIYDATFSTLKRTLTANTNSVDYTSAQQVTDHGSTQQTLYLKIRQISSVVGGGNWLQQSITRVGPADPYAAFVTSLVHFNGSNGSTTIIDVKGNTWACSGNAQLTTTSPLYGTASGLFDGNADFIYSNSAAAFAYGTGDYCIDIAFKLAATGSAQTLCDYRPASTNGAYPCLYVNASNQIEYYVNTGIRITGTTTLTSGTLYRARVARVSGVTRIFINGTQEGSSWTDSSNMLVGGTTRPVLGSSAYSAGGYLNGRIDEYRSTKGAGRSSANYTVETNEFPDP